MPSFALAAIGRDRPGIVAGVAKVLFDAGCNVEDSSMTLLRGNFAIMLVLSGPDDVTGPGLEAALQPMAGDLGLTVSVQEVTDTSQTPHPSHILTVYGGDRPGILLAVAETLAAAGVNITDLNSRLVGEEASPVYALMLELAVVGDTTIDDVEAGLNRVAAEVGVDLSLRAIDDDVL